MKYTTAIISFYCVLLSNLAFANYENTIHYVWMGNLETEQRKDLASYGPKRLQDLITVTPKYAETKINIWVREYCFESAKKHFSSMPNITIVSADNFFLSDGVQYFSPEEITTVFLRLDYYDEQGQYAWEKDLMAFLVVAELGGYFFDTTTYFISLDADLFNNTLEKRLGFITNRQSYSTSNNQWGSPFERFTDYQLFSAPQKGDPMFIHIMKEFISLMKNGMEVDVVSHLNSAVASYYENIDDPFEYAWGSTIVSLADQSSEYVVRIYSELNLIKLAAGSWRYGKPFGSVSGGLNSRYLETAKRVLERFPLPNH